MADTSEELTKLEEVYSFGFITREEYEVRLRALGVDIPSAVTAEPHAEESNQDVNGSQFAFDHSYHFDVHDTISSFNNSSFNTYNNTTSNIYHEPSFNSYNDTSSSYDDISSNSYNNPTLCYSVNNHVDQLDSPLQHDHYEEPFHENHYERDLNKLPQYGDHHEIHSYDNHHIHSNQNNESSLDGNGDPQVGKHTNTHTPIQIQKIFKATPPPPNTLRTDADNYLSGLYYLDPSKSGVVIYFKDLRGTFQTAPLQNPTLETILNGFGITYGSLLRVHLSEESSQTARSGSSDSAKRDTSRQNSFVPEYDLYNQVLPGHYILLQSSTMLERGSWQMRTDRGHMIHSYNDIFAYKAFFNKVQVRKRTEDHRSYGYTRGSPSIGLKYATLRESDSKQFIKHFFLRLRFLESKWTHGHEIQAVKKLSQCLQESKCFFCESAAISSTAPFCTDHADDGLTKLFTHFVSSKLWKAVATRNSEADEGEVGAAQQEEENERQLAARQLYEKHVARVAQYRYLDVSLAEVQKRLLAHTSPSPSSLSSLP